MVTKTINKTIILLLFNFTQKFDKNSLISQTLINKIYCDEIQCNYTKNGTLNLVFRFVGLAGLEPATP